MTSPQFRAALRSGAAALGLAITATINYLAPDVPNELLAVWGAVFMALFGIGEAYYDAKHGG